MSWQVPHAELNGLTRRRGCGLCERHPPVTIYFLPAFGSGSDFQMTTARCCMYRCLPQPVLINSHHRRRTRGHRIHASPHGDTVCSRGRDGACGRRQQLTGSDGLHTGRRIRTTCPGAREHLAATRDAATRTSWALCTRVTQLQDDYLPTSTCQVGPMRFSVSVLMKQAILSSSWSGKFLFGHAVSVDLASAPPSQF